MSTVELNHLPHDAALSHLALYGMVQMAEDAGIDIRLGWSTAQEPRPVLTSSGDTVDGISAAVLASAQANKWTSERIDVNGKPRGLMSPRITPKFEEVPWPDLALRRQAVIDDASDSVAAQRLFGGLGEPSYWYENRRREHLLYGGAAQWDLQPRNQGSELVGTKLDKLRAAVSTRSAAQIADALTGRRVVDDLGGTRTDSRTATGLAPLGPTDSVLAWCGLWGLAWLPVVHRMAPALSSITAGSLRGRDGQRQHDAMVLPVFDTGMTPARVRAVLAGDAMTAALDRSASEARAWLLDHGVRGLMRFEVKDFGTSSAPERRTLTGYPVALR